MEQCFIVRLYSSCRQYLLQLCVLAEPSYTVMYLGQGFAEIVRHKQTVKAYSGNLDTAYHDSLAARRQRPPEVCPVPHICI